MGRLCVARSILARATIIAGFSLFMITSHFTSSVAADRTIHGNIFYNEKIALPPEADLHVQLTDVSPTEIGTKILAETRITSIGQTPVPFSLNFNNSHLSDGHIYTLQARIAAGDTLWFVNDQQYYINPRTSQALLNVKMVMVHTEAKGVQADTLKGFTWFLENIHGSDVVRDRRTTLTIDANDEVNGSGGCNHYFTKALLSPQTLSFGAIGSTYMQCPPAFMNQESKFFDALSKIRSFKIEMGKLFLLDEKGQEILRLVHHI